MLVTVDRMKELLGLPDSEDPVADPVLERSSLSAQSLVDSYVGFSVELNDAVPENADIRYELYGVRVIRLRSFPATLVSVKIDDVVVSADQYKFNSALGMLEFREQRGSIRQLEILYRPGYTPENAPQEIVDVISNIAIAIYENGGRVQMQAGSGQLKSMTMFDAMSMSFDTGSVQSGTPESLVSQWGFVLNRHRVDKFVMGGP
jgi:hypothetical protein